MTHEPLTSSPHNTKVPSLGWFRSEECKTYAELQRAHEAAINRERVLDGLDGPGAICPPDPMNLPRDLWPIAFHTPETDEEEPPRQAGWVGCWWWGRV